MVSTKLIQEENDACLSAMQLTMGSVLPMALQTAIHLGVFDIIAKAGPGVKLSALDIAAKMGGQNQGAPIMVERLARLLASHNVLSCILSEDSERLYSLSPVSCYFSKHQNGVSFGPYMDLFHDQIFMGSWSYLKDAVLDGGIAFDRARGTNSYEYTGLDDKFNKVFNLAMVNLTTIIMKKVVESYKGFEGIKQLVDVGGCQGITLKAVTSKYPHIKGINFDLPHVVEHAPSYHGVEHVAGDMFESVPSGDAIFIKGMLHAWDDEYCLKLLKNCYEALPDNGKVIALESIIPTTTETTPASKIIFIMDVVMMTQHHGGKERTKEDIIALAKKAKFNKVNFSCVICQYSIMEFIKIKT